MRKYSRKRCDMEEFQDTVRLENIIGSGAMRKYSRKRCDETVFRKQERILEKVVSVYYILEPAYGPTLKQAFS